MEALFEFMFGASGRINRAEYWRSMLRFVVAGLLAGVILSAAAGIATSLLVISIVLLLMPWLIWGLAVHTERLHDRDKSAWWLLAFFLTPGVLDHLARTASSAGHIEMTLHYLLEFAAIGLAVWGFIEIGCLGGTAGPNRYGPNPAVG